MSDLSNKILSATSKGVLPKAILVLEDGTTFYGRCSGALGESFGEICFNTSLEGYLEVISDPSYAGQIVVMTYPQIGNYGINSDDYQRSSPALQGLVVHSLCKTPSNWRSQLSLDEYLKNNSIVAIEGIDTRALVRHIRDVGAMRAGISSEDLDKDSMLEKVRKTAQLAGKNLVETVSNPDNCMFSQKKPSRDFAIETSSVHKDKYNIVALDCGVKDSILECMVRLGCNVDVLPWDASPDKVLSLNPDGVFVSNGPGDPDAVCSTYQNVQSLLGKVPVFGICMGHQMLSKAADAKMEKLKFGHHGGNQPVMNLLTGRVEITAQNHGFGQVFESLGPLIKEESGGFNEHVSDLRVWVQRKIAPVVLNEKFGRIRLTHVNLNDGTPEGMTFLDVPAFSVQYHPEASPGPTDSHYLFNAFLRLMDGQKDYLDIDIAKDRLSGWRF